MLVAASKVERQLRDLLMLLRTDWKELIIFFHLCYRKLKYFSPLSSYETKGFSFILEISKVTKIRKAAHC